LPLSKYKHKASAYCPPWNNTEQIYSPAVVGELRGGSGEDARGTLTILHSSVYLYTTPGIQCNKYKQKKHLQISGSFLLSAKNCKSSCLVSLLSHFCLNPLPLPATCTSYISWVNCGTWLHYAPNQLSQNNNSLSRHLQLD